MVMSLTDKFVNMLWRFGREARVTKKDLVSSYKSLRVNTYDLKYHVVKFGERYIVEVCLMFEVRLSPSICCRLLSLYIKFVALLLDVWDELVTPYLWQALVFFSEMCSSLGWYQTYLD